MRTRTRTHTHTHTHTRTHTLSTHTKHTRTHTHTCQRLPLPHTLSLPRSSSDYIYLGPTSEDCLYLNGGPCPAHSTVPSRMRACTPASRLDLRSVSPEQRHWAASGDGLDLWRQL